MGREERQKADAQAAALDVFNVLHSAPSGRQFAKRPADVLDVRPARICRFYRSTRAVEYLYAEFFFEIENALRERWLRDVQSRSGARKAAVIGDGQQVVSLAAEHNL
jgi:hypothetical protein